MPVIRVFCWALPFILCCQRDRNVDLRVAKFWCFLFPRHIARPSEGSCGQDAKIKRKVKNMYDTTMTNWSTFPNLFNRPILLANHVSKTTPRRNIENNVSKITPTIMDRFSSNRLKSFLAIAWNMDMINLSPASLSQRCFQRTFFSCSATLVWRMEENDLWIRFVPTNLQGSLFTLKI